jgi:hypothetical protein
MPRGVIGEGPAEFAPVRRDEDAPELGLVDLLL